MDDYCVVYLRGRVLYDHCPVARAYVVFVMYALNGSLEGMSDSEIPSAGDLYSNLDVFVSCLMKDHEVHALDNEGDRLLDIFYVSG